MLRMLHLLRLLHPVSAFHRFKPLYPWNETKRPKQSRYLHDDADEAWNRTRDADEAPQAKPSPGDVHLKNAQESFISHFLSRGHIKHRFRKENASERPQTALKRKPFEGQLRATAYPQKAKPVASCDKPHSLPRNPKAKHEATPGMQMKPRRQSLHPECTNGDDRGKAYAYASTGIFMWWITP